MEYLFWASQTLASYTCRRLKCLQSMPPADSFVPQAIKNPCSIFCRGFYLALDDDLLSHGETPHYHRRCIVSLLSSEWIQVVPMLYVRQAILLAATAKARLLPNRICDKNKIFGNSCGSQIFSFACSFSHKHFGVIWSSLTGN